MAESKGYCDLSGHTAIVTGASGGIGSAIALELGRAGADVAVHYNKNKSNAEKVAGRIESSGGKAKPFKLDLRDFDGIPSFVEAVSKELSPADILVNNAGINMEGFLVRLTQEDVSEVFNVNLMSTFYLSRECAKYMMKNRWGRLVYISSPAAVAGSPAQSAYAASKSGLSGFSKSISLELGKRNITSNVVIPGIIETDMLTGMTDDRRTELTKRIPIGRFGDPAEVGKFIRFVVSEEASYLNGQELHLNGGGVIY